MLTYWHYQSPNFGDLLTPFILKKYVHLINKKIKTRKSDNIEDAYVIGIGSILDTIPKSYKGVIWTTGNAQSAFFLDLSHNTKIRILGVRGPKTLSHISLPQHISREQVLFGDGAIVLPHIFPRTQTEYEWDLGIIPHIGDSKRTKQLKWLTSRQDVLILNPKIETQTQVGNFIRRMWKCKKIISSGLHGLIVADAYGIPNCRYLVSTSRKIIGGDLKFDDYYASLNISDHEFINLEDTRRWIDLLPQIERLCIERPQVQVLAEKLHDATIKMISLK